MKNFKKSEFECKCCRELPADAWMNTDALVANLLDPVRDRFGKPIKVNSGYRCEKHNRKVGGSPRSQHLCQNGSAAADITVEHSGYTNTAAWKEANKQIAGLIIKNGKFDQLILRCHFGNAWQHWMDGNRQKAQYTRDVWARRIQRKISNIGVDALYVHLFLNGMYWGLYNIAERIDDTFGKNHFGGKKPDYDVIKIEEDGGNHLEASEGTMDAYYEMVNTAVAAGGHDSSMSAEEAYEKLDSLLDKDKFIDYMIINQYAGNDDWDHHNWYAIRRRGTDSDGFKFLCWDSEIILTSPTYNAVTKFNNGGPTYIFNALLGNEDFATRYINRAKELLCDDGLLGRVSRDFF